MVIKNNDFTYCVWFDRFNHFCLSCWGLNRGKDDLRAWVIEQASQWYSIGICGFVIKNSQSFSETMVWISCIWGWPMPTSPSKSPATETQRAWMGIPWVQNNIKAEFDSRLCSVQFVCCVRVDGHTNTAIDKGGSSSGNPLTTWRLKVWWRCHSSILRKCHSIWN